MALKNFKDSPRDQNSCDRRKKYPGIENENANVKSQSLFSVQLFFSCESVKGSEGCRLRMQRLMY